jgi:hypothetical protein
MPGGDVLVSVTQHRGATAEVLGLSTFFTGKRFMSVEAAFGGKYRPQDDGHRAKLRDRLYVVALSQGMNSCMRGMGDVIRIEDESGRVLRQKTVLVVLDKARKSKVLTCEENSTGGFMYRVATVFGRVLALEDGTFLLADRDSGLVVRLTENLETQSPLLESKVFVVEPGFLQGRFNESLNRDGTPDWGKYQADLLAWAQSQRGQMRTSQ